MAQKVSPQIEFAKRHLSPGISTFNASTALARIDALIRDAKSIQEKTVDNSYSYSWNFEFISYYTVGYITCLEWHARSRLYDLFTFDSRTIDISELKQSVSDTKLMQMMSENFTVSHLIASSTNVSSLERYIQIFDRIFNNISGGVKTNSLLSKKNENGETILSKIAEAYEFRNYLVHEIGSSVVGHPNIRDWHSFSDAIDIGECILSGMRDIEASITANAPASFPNLLDEEYYPVDKFQKLNNDIYTLESEISSAIKNNLAPDDLTIDIWNSLVSTSKSARDFEIENINRLDLAGARYYDIRPFLIESIQIQRINYLKLYQKEIIGYY